MNARLERTGLSIRRQALSGAVVLALVSGGMSGCGGSRPDEKALAKASASMHGMGVSGSEALPSITDRRSRYEAVIQAMKPIADSTGGDGSRAAAAGQLVAQASAGLGEIAAREASQAEQDSLARVAAIRSAFDQWLSQKSIADGLRSYDPSKALARLDEEIAQREAEGAATRTEKQKQEALVAGTLGKAKRARDQAEVFRAQEGQVRAAVATGTQTQRAAALESALGVKRQGDEFEKQAAGFEAEAGAQSPEIGAIQANINKLSQQVDLLREAKASLNKRADENRKQAAAALAEADEGAKAVTRLVKDLDESRGAVQAPFDQAVKQYGAAVAAARKASGSAGKGGMKKDISNLTAGSYQQSLADLHAARARGLGSYASIMQTLNRGGQPGIGTDLAARARASADEAYKAAREAYSAAMTFYEGAGGGSPETKERIGRLATEIKKMTVEAGSGEPGAGAPTGTGEGVQPGDEKGPVETPAGKPGSKPAGGGDTGTPDPGDK